MGKIIKIQAFIKMKYLYKMYRRKLMEGKKNKDLALFF